MDVEVSFVDPGNQTAETLLALLGETAVQGASLYAAHSGRLAATAEDVKRALMLEVLVYAKRPGILERVGAIQHELSSSRREHGAPCPDGCALCRWFNTIYQEWARWEPQTPIEIELKTHIDLIDFALRRV